MTDARTEADRLAASLAARVANDLKPLEGWTVTATRGAADARADSLDLRLNTIDTVITVEHDGNRKLVLEFYTEEDFWEQAVNALWQLQDTVVETELRAWPRCPLHEHVLVPEESTGGLYWVCPEDGRTAVRVGDL